MTKKMFWIAAAAFAALAPNAAIAQQTGDWVLGQWRGGSEWYPGVIAGRSGNNLTIRYDDGTTETRPANQVRPFNWRAGSRVVCRFTNGQWYDATITRMDPGGLTVNVRFDDGDTLQTETGKCRQEN